jgi:hypothetical protein
MRLPYIIIYKRGCMDLYETREGDKWVCVTCRYEQAEKIEQEKWEWILEKHDPILRCSICHHPDYEIED